MPRRILLLITDLEIGGTPTVVRELAKRLAGWNGTSIHVACLSTAGPVAAQITAADIPVHALAARGRFDVSIVPKLLNLIHRESIDTVFSFLVHANVVAAVAATRTPCVRWIQSIQTTQPKPRWHWWIQAIAQHAAEKIVVPSHSVARAARDRSNVPDEKIEVIPNAIDLDDYPLNLPRVNPAARRIGFIGRLDPVKRVVDLVAAIALLPAEFTLDIYGEGGERDSIESHVRALGLVDRVTMHGAITDPRIALEKMDILVLPSLAEGFGLVLIEAMASGVAVAATSVAGIIDVIEPGRTGLLSPAMDPRALAENIQLLADDVVLRRRLIETAADEVARRFSWKIVLPHYARLLDIV